MVTLQVGLGALLLGAGGGSFAAAWYFASAKRLSEHTRFLSWTGVAAAVGSVLLIAAIPS